MTRKATRVRPPLDGMKAIRTRLHEAEETLRAIRAGEVDAMVVDRGGEHIITLSGGELAYRILFEQMNEGAVTLTRDGVIAYCNRRFAEIVRTSLAGVIGTPFCHFIPPEEQVACDALCRRGSLGNAREELTFRAGDGVLVPVALSFAPLHTESGTDVIGIVGVVRDITERKENTDRRARLMAQVMTAQDEERRRIARELHDETGQSLTALLVGLRTIEESRTITKAAELARRLRRTVAETLDEVGRMARGLHPGTLDDLGLAAAVSRQVQEFIERHGIAVEMRIEGLEQGPLPPLLETTVYRVLQEALTNVAKHAHARRVGVRLARDGATVELRVQDDGIGVDPSVGAEAAAGGRRGLGLQGIRERAALLGGSVEMESGPGVGTTIRAHFPVNAA